MLSWEERFKIGILDYDITMNPQIGMSANILIKNLQHSLETDQHQFEAILGKPGFVAFDQMDQPACVVEPHSPLPVKVQIQSRPDKHVLLDSMPGSWLILNHVHVVGIDPLSVCLDDTTVLFDLASSKKHALTCLELCCGGFGGWSFAMSFLRKHHQFPFARTVAIDHDHFAVQNWILNHHGSYIESTQTIPWQLPELIPGNIAIVAALQDLHWRQSVALMKPDIITLSAPCVSWSGAHNQAGLYAEGGLVLSEGIQLAKFLRPRALLIEQVKNFPSHQHFPKVMRLLTAAGFRLIFGKVLEAANTTPMYRARWIGIAVDVYSHDLYDLGLFQTRWMGDMYFHPASFECMVELTESEKRSMTLSPDVQSKYLNPRLAPKSFRNRFMHHRCPSVFEKMPTLMAAYGRQHCFNDADLQRHGLYGHLLKSSDDSQSTEPTFRFWHPKELALMFGVHEAICLLKPAARSWQHLGNAITTNHALFALAAVAPLLLHHPPQVDTYQAMQTYLVERLRTSNLKTQDHSQCWILSHSDVADMKAVHVLEFFRTITKETGSIPSATMFHPQVGIKSYKDIELLWKQIHDIPQPMDMSPTQQDWMKLQIRIHDQVFEGASIQINALVDTVAKLWDYHATPAIADSFQHPHPDSLHFQQLWIGEIADANMQHPEIAHLLPVLAYVEQQAWIVTQPQGTSMEQIFAGTGISQKCFLPMGEVPDTRTLQAPIVLFDQLPEIQTLTGDLFPFVTLHVLTSMWFTCDRIKDETTMHIDLSSIDSDFQPQAKEFWRLALPKQEWMNRHGRHIECNDEQNRLSIRMTPNKTVIPLPHPDLKLVCAFHALKCFFTSIAAQTTQPCLPVVFKWEGYVIWKGQLPACTHMVWLRAVIQVFTDSITNRTDLSFVAFGTRIGDENTFEQIMQRASPNRPPRHLLIVMAPLVSGGGAKTEWDTQIRNQIAAALIDVGISVSHLPQITDSVLKTVGRSKLQQVLKNNNTDKLQPILLQYVQQAGFAIPTSSKKTMPTFKKPKADAMKQELQDFDMTGITIEPGFFTDSDSNNIQQRDRLYPKSTGLVLAKESEIRQWLQGNDVLSPDPLAAFVIGTNHIETKLPQQNIIIPVRTRQGNPLLLAGTLIQFGETHVRFRPQQGTDVFQKETDTKVVSITAWKTDFAEETWTDLVRQPIHFVQSHHQTQDQKPQFLTVWGLSFRDAKGPVDKNKADSLQLHATVALPQLPDLLRKSGSQGFYLTPKTPNGSPDADWKIIWLKQPHHSPGAHAEALRQMSKLDQPFGLIRNKTTFGIRVRADTHSQAWKQLYPHDPVPASVADKNMYKVSPLPFGSSTDAITEWISHIHWAAIPVRPIGSQTWLIASAADPPTPFQAYNGTPVLIRRLPPKTNKAPSIVVAGAKDVPKQSVTTELGTPDPWASYTPLTNMPSASGINEPKTDATIGPYQHRLQQQDDKIQALSEELQTIKQSQQDNMKQIDDKFDHVHELIDTTNTSFTQQMQQVKTDLQSTFQQAINQQNTSIQTGFAEIKAMFQQRTSVRRTREDMEDGDTSM